MLGTLKIWGRCLQALETKTPYLLMAFGNPKPMFLIVKLCSFSPFGNAFKRQPRWMDPAKPSNCGLSMLFTMKKNVSLWGLLNLGFILGIPGSLKLLLTPYISTGRWCMECRQGAWDGDRLFLELMLILASPQYWTWLDWIVSLQKSCLWALRMWHYLEIGLLQL